MPVGGFGSSANLPPDASVAIHLGVQPVLASYEPYMKTLDRLMNKSLTQYGSLAGASGKQLLNFNSNVKQQVKMFQELDKALNPVVREMAQLVKDRQQFIKLSQGQPLSTQEVKRLGQIEARLESNKEFLRFRHRMQTHLPSLSSAAESHASTVDINKAYYTPVPQSLIDRAMRGGRGGGGGGRGAGLAGFSLFNFGGNNPLLRLGLSALGITGAGDILSFVKNSMNNFETSQITAGRFQQRLGVPSNTLFNGFLGGWPLGFTNQTMQSTLANFVGASGRTSVLGPNLQSLSTTAQFARLSGLDPTVVGSLFGQATSMGVNSDAQLQRFAELMADAFKKAGLDPQTMLSATLAAGNMMRMLPNANMGLMGTLVAQLSQVGGPNGPANLKGLAGVQSVLAPMQNAMTGSGLGSPMFWLMAQGMGFDQGKTSLFAVARAQQEGLQGPGRAGLIQGLRKMSGGNGNFLDFLMSQTFGITMDTAQELRTTKMSNGGTFLDLLGSDQKLSSIQNKMRSSGHSEWAQMLSQAQGTQGFSFEQLNANIDRLSVAIGQQFAPAVAGIGNDIGNLAKWISNYTDILKTALQVTAISAGAAGIGGVASATKGIAGMFGASKAGSWLSKALKIGGSGAAGAGAEAVVGGAAGDAAAGLAGGPVIGGVLLAGLLGSAVYGLWKSINNKNNNGSSSNTSALGMLGLPIGMNPYDLSTSATQLAQNGLPLPGSSFGVSSSGTGALLPAASTSTSSSTSTSLPFVRSATSGLLKNSKPIDDIKQWPAGALKYKDNILMASALFHLPTSVIVGVMSHESGFNVGARNHNKNGTIDFGLMQLNSKYMSGRAASLTNILNSAGIPGSVTPQELETNPMYNILGGAMVLAGDIKGAGGDLFNGLAAYNGSGQQAQNYAHVVSKVIANLQKFNWGTGLNGSKVTDSQVSAILQGINAQNAQVVVQNATINVATQTGGTWTRKNS